MNQSVIVAPARVNADCSNQTTLAFHFNNITRRVRRVCRSHCCFFAEFIAIVCDGTLTSIVCHMQRAGHCRRMRSCLRGL